MESLIEILEKWRDIAYTKQRQAIRELDSNESNYQLGKIRMCNDLIEEINKELEQNKESQTSKERNTQGEQSND